MTTKRDMMQNPLLAAFLCTMPMPNNASVLGKVTIVSVRDVRQWEWTSGSSAFLGEVTVAVEPAADAVAVMTAAATEMEARRDRRREREDHAWDVEVD